ncbi:MAG: DUF177 domain-containing protein [Pseudomonadota bacterium]
MNLTVKITDLPREGIELPLEIPVEKGQGRLNEVERELISLVSPITGRIRLEPTGRRVVARGKIEARLRAECSRCLEEFEFPVSEEIFLIFSPHPETGFQEELEAEALDMDYYAGDEIDLWPVIQEHLFLGLPIKLLCREDCQGLCPDCGQNRNLRPCKCSVSRKASGLAALMKIRDKLPS